MDEAKRVASNIAKLPTLLGRGETIEFGAGKILFHWSIVAGLSHAYLPHEMAAPSGSILKGNDPVNQRVSGSRNQRAELGEVRAAKAYGSARLGYRCAISGGSLQRAEHSSKHHQGKLLVVR
jgi:hypothetical protein